MNETDIEVLVAQLMCYIKNNNKNPHKSGLFYSDGVKFLIQQTNCLWLVDTILYSQNFNSLKSNETQSIEIKVSIYHQTGVIKFKDKDENIIHTQNICITDFPIKELTLYFKNNIVMLMSEK